MESPKALMKILTVRCKTNVLCGNWMCSLKDNMYSSSPKCVIVCVWEACAAPLNAWHWATMLPSCCGSQPGATATVMCGNESLSLTILCCDCYCTSLWTNIQMLFTLQSLLCIQKHISQLFILLWRVKCRCIMIIQERPHSRHQCCTCMLKSGNVQQYKQSTVDCKNWKSIWCAMNGSM